MYVHDNNGILASIYDGYNKPNLFIVNKNIGLVKFSEKANGTEVYLIL